MIPNNNLSVLPWYTSIEQQNARKWWVYGRIYPLFTPAGQILPFQITRPERTGYAPGALINNEEYDNGYLDFLGNWKQDNITPAGVSEYNVSNLNRVYIENLPRAYEPSTLHRGTVNIVFERNGELLKTEKKVDDYFTGLVNVPDGATTMLIQSYNEQVGTENARVYDTILEILRVQSLSAYHADGTGYADLTQYIPNIFQYKRIGDTDIIIYNGASVGNWEIGQFYLQLSDGVDTWYSDVFTVVQDMAGYLKLEWWDTDDFVMDGGTIVYTEPEFKNVLYLCSDIAKPEYDYTEEVIERDGYTFPIKQVSAKRYRFSFLAPEYLLDVMRFVRMADYIRITKDGETYMNIDTFLITPDWEKNGDVAVVDAEFTTGTVAKKIGRGYVIASRNE